MHRTVAWYPVSSSIP
jgi:hypothetical protein